MRVIEDGLQKSVVREGIGDFEECVVETFFVEGLAQCLFACRACLSVGCEEYIVDSHHLVVMSCRFVNKVLRLERSRFLGMHGCNYALFLGGIGDVERGGGCDQYEQQFEHDRFV